MHGCTSIALPLLVSFVLARGSEVGDRGNPLVSIPQASLGGTKHRQTVAHGVHNSFVHWVEYEEGRGRLRWSKGRGIGEWPGWVTRCRRLSIIPLSFSSLPPLSPPPLPIPIGHSLAPTARPVRMDDYHETAQLRARIASIEDALRPRRADMYECPSQSGTLTASRSLTHTRSGLVPWRVR